MNIEIISGSPRKESHSFRMALYLQKKLSAKTQHHVGIIDVREWNMPLLQNVYSNIDNAPKELQPLAEKIFKANAFILVSPEFNGSYTPALKNLLDHFPKQMHKAFGIVTASPGAMGGIRASQQMQLLVNALFGIASPCMLITPFIDQKFSPAGKQIDESFQANINTFIHEFLWLAESIYPK